MAVITPIAPRTRPTGRRGAPVLGQDGLGHSSALKQTGETPEQPDGAVRLAEGPLI